MPIYEYNCKKCGHEFEEIVYGEGTPECPKCGSTETQKLMSCCVHHGGGTGGSEYSAPVSSGGGCHGCSGGNCASCGH